MRSLASVVGVTHQKLGRWLREGEKGGVAQIPNDRATIAAINQAFDIHRDMALEQARIDDVPFDPVAPIYTYRPYLEETGEQGERTFTHGTQFIRADTRGKIIEGVRESGRYYTVSARSHVDLDAYFKRAQDNYERLAKKRKHGARNQDELSSMRQLKFLLTHRVEVAPIYTKYVHVGKNVPPGQAAEALNARLKEKHEPATTVPGTSLADMFLFQLYPAHYGKAKPRKVRKTAGHRKTISGRGPK